MSVAACLCSLAKVATLWLVKCMVIIPLCDWFLCWYFWWIAVLLFCNVNGGCAVIQHYDWLLYGYLQLMLVQLASCPSTATATSCWQAQKTEHWKSLTSWKGASFTHCMDTRSEFKTFPMDGKKEMCNDQFELLQRQFSFACCCFVDVSFITLDMNAEREPSSEGPSELLSLNRNVPGRNQTTMKEYSM